MTCITWQCLCIRLFAHTPFLSAVQTHNAGQIPPQFIHRICKKQPTTKEHDLYLTQDAIYDKNTNNHDCEQPDFTSHNLYRLTQAHLH